jgi:hypothetical protein
MANTWTARTNGVVAFASNKSMIALVNLASSGVVVRVYRIWALNLNTGTVSNGIATPIQVSRVTTAQTTTAGITGTQITPTAHDTTNTALTNKVACYTNATTNMSTVANSTYRRVLVTVDEPASTALTPDEYWCFPKIAEIFTVGYRDTTVEPIVLRPGEGIEVRQPGANALGSFEFAITFTSGAS